MSRSISVSDETYDAVRELADWLGLEPGELVARSHRAICMVRALTLRGVAPVTALQQMGDDDG